MKKRVLSACLILSMLFTSNLSFGGTAAAYEEQEELSVLEAEDPSEELELDLEEEDYLIENDQAASIDIEENISSDKFTDAAGEKTIYLTGETLTIKGTGTIEKSEIEEFLYDYRYETVTQIIIDQGITAIGDSAFGGTKWSKETSFYDLKKVVLPESLTEIGTAAFRGCYNLSEVSLPNRVKVGPYAFADTGLKSIVIPKGSEIGECSFSNCNELVSVLIDKSVVIDKPEYFSPYHTTPDKLGPFTGCVQLKTASPIGKGGNIQFGWTDTLPAHAFGGSCIESIIFPSSIKSIGAYCFYGSNIAVLKIPDTVTTVGSYAFSCCDYLRHIILPPVSIDTEGKTSSYNTLFDRTPKLVSVGPYASECSIEYSWTDSLPAYIFYGSGIKMAKISKIESIETSAFFYCPNLEEVHIFGDVKKVKYAAFEACDSLQTVTMDEGVEEIGGYAFASCPNLKTVYIPKSVKSMAFPFADKEKVTVICEEGSYAYRVCKQFGYKVLKPGEEAGDDPVDEEKTYLTVHFDANGGQGNKMDDLLVERDDCEVIPDCEYTKQGYTFTSWNTKANGTGKKYDAYDDIKNKEKENCEITLYAQWQSTKEGSYITYVLNGGTNNPKNKDFIEKGEDFKLFKPSRDCYEFDCWCSDQKLSKKKTKLKGKTGVNFTVYAKWSPISYKIKYDMPKDAKIKTKNPESYDITKEIILNNPTRKGYKFTGWYTDSSLTKKVTKINKGTYGDLKLYSGWTPIEYTIVYDGNGATSGNTEKTVHAYKASGKIASCGYTKTGYAFDKWNKKSNGKGTAYQAGYSKNDLTTTDGDCITLYAKWKQITYSVTFNPNTGNPKYDNSSKYKTTKKNLNYNKEFTVPDCTAKKDGFIFVGWNSMPDGSGTMLHSGDKAKKLSNEEGRIDYYGIWKPQITNIYFMQDKLTIVINQPINVNDFVTIVPEDAANRSLKWKSKDTKVATVDNSGILTGKKIGATILTASAQDGSKNSVSILVEVISCTRITFPLSQDYRWYCTTYPGHGSAYASAFSSIDITLDDGSPCEGLPVYSMEKGIVVSRLDDNGQIVIKHQTSLITTNGVEYKEWYSAYAHMKNICVNVNDSVSAGQHIGDVSSVGKAEGSHLHVNIMSAEDGLSWYQNIDTKYAISPYYIYGFVDINGKDLDYLHCDRKGDAVTERLINHIPQK